MKISIKCKNKNYFYNFYQNSRKNALETAEKKVLELTATAEKRKKLLDEMATEKFELNQELTQVKERYLQKRKES